MTPVAGFLAVDKPGGLTSHDVVAKVRRATGISKAGHAGTLDPMATGLVIVALGRATRLIRYVQDLPKEYEATAAFGIATDTLDADGEEVERIPMSFSTDDLVEVVPGFTGRIMQVPPMVSALKQEGRRLYDLAREGIEVEREPRPIEVHELELLEVGTGPFPAVRFRVVCGKGTYVRVLADDLARSLGGRAHLVALRRTRTGPISLDAHGVPVERLAEWRDLLIEPNTALAHLPGVTVDEATVTRIGHGRTVELPGAPGGGTPFRVLAGDRLVAVFRASETGPRSEVVLR